MLQRVPPEGGYAVIADDVEDGWRRAMVLMSSATAGELVDPELPPRRLLFRLFHEEGVRVFDTHPIEARCRCSRERIDRILRAFPPDEHRRHAQGPGHHRDLRVLQHPLRIHCRRPRSSAAQLGCMPPGRLFPAGFDVAVQPILDQPASDQIEPRQTESVVVDMRQEPVALVPARILELAVIDCDLARQRLGVKAEHDVGREWPGLRGMVVHRADLDAGLFEHFARDRVFEALAWFDKAGEGRIHAGDEILVASHQCALAIGHQHDDGGSVRGKCIASQAGSVQRRI